MTPPILFLPVWLLLITGCRPDGVDLKDDAVAETGEDSGLDSGLDSGEDSTDSGAETGDPAGLSERPSNLTCLAQDRPVSDASVALPRVYTNLRFTFPVVITQAPGDDTRFFIVEQGGRIQVFDNVATPATPRTALDIADRLSDEEINEDGFLGLAFHPDFVHNGDIYVNYTVGDWLEGTLHTVIARYHSDDDGETFGPDSEVILLTVGQPYANHNGGNLVFGPDGYLYIGLGDGGSGGDPLGNGQNTDVLLGKMLRIDVDHPGGGLNYGIPADNPFVDGVDGAPEIYAWGLRNPWRYAFDREDGTLWAGDVGQDTYEEIDVVERGGNYGWNTMEGLHCYRADACDQTGLVLPVVELDHDHSDSILGGVVYRGAAIPGLQGAYVFGDTYRGLFWTIGYDAVTGTAFVADLTSVPGLVPSSIGEDQAGELYVLDWAGGGIYRFEAAGEGAVDTFPTLLSQTGCVDSAHPTLPAAGMIPYGVNLPLWSDGADKERWMALPDGQQLHLAEDGAVVYPVGSVLMKHFSVAGTRVETRLLMLHEDGNWAGYSYAWNEAGTDAELLPSSSAVEVGGMTWGFPSRSECLRCHTESAGRVLGPRVLQLNGDFTYPNGVTANQIETLVGVNLLDNPPTDIASQPAYPHLDDTDASDAAVADRARAYLAVNCGVCHAPGGTGGGSMDLRYETPFTAMGICDTPPTNGDLGVADARLFAPGAPERSVLSLRMRATDVTRMPGIGSQVVDEVGVAAIEAWIRGVAACE